MALKPSDFCNIKAIFPYLARPARVLQPVNHCKKISFNARKTLVMCRMLRAGEKSLRLPAR